MKSVGSATYVVRPSTTKCPGGASPVVLLPLTLVYMTMRLHYVHVHSLIPVLRDRHFRLDIITTISQEKY